MPRGFALLILLCALIGCGTRENPSSSPAAYQRELVRSLEAFEFNMLRQTTQAFPRGMQNFDEPTRRKEMAELIEKEAYQIRPIIGRIRTFPAPAEMANLRVATLGVLESTESYMMDLSKEVGDGSSPIPENRADLVWPGLPKALDQLIGAIKDSGADVKSLEGFAKELRKSMPQAP